MLHGLVFAIVDELLGGARAERAGVAHVERHHRLALPAAQRVQGQIIRDREQPRREFRPRPILLAHPVDAEKNFLREIFRFFQLAQKVLQHRDEAVVVEVHQLGERRRIVVADAQHDADVRITQRQLPAGLAGASHGVLTRGSHLR